MVEDKSHASAIFRPELFRFERYIAVAVFLLSVAYLLLFRRFTTLEPDEGIVLQGAQRILHGEVLYRDNQLLCGSIEISDEPHSRRAKSATDEVTVVYEMCKGW